MIVDVFASLDRLAELAAGGVDVRGVLEREEVCLKGDNLAGLSLRVSPTVLEQVDALAEALSDSPEARIAGRWGRSAVLRIALEEGLKVLAKRTKAGGR